MLLIVFMYYDYRASFKNAVSQRVSEVKKLF